MGRHHLRADDVEFLLKCRIELDHGARSNVERLPRRRAAGAKPVSVCGGPSEDRA
jgi:hypothetical protein